MVLAADTSLILVGLIYPVEAGQNVTLRCSDTTSGVVAVFLKDDRVISSRPSDQVTLYHVSRDDEGHYRCRSGKEDSPSSFLLVRG